MDPSELKEQIPRNANSHLPDFNELQRRLNELESKLRLQPEFKQVSVLPSQESNISQPNSQADSVKDRVYFQNRIRDAV